MEKVITEQEGNDRAQEIKICRRDVRSRWHFKNGKKSWEIRPAAAPLDEYKDKTASDKPIWLPLSAREQNDHQKQNA